ncbi:MAG TPA: protein kinase [Chthoniobacterales bacterium]|nr:protein kinase [Chthoniobacterales bacterium]
MEPETFLEHYRICRGEAGHEVSRSGAAINYKAIDLRTRDRVRLQLIPLATIEPEKLAQLKERAETAEKLDHVNIAKTFAVGVDHDYFVIVSEHIEGETADSWIVENGPMPADAALRVGLQVVRALGAAAYFNLTHRAIQPSNIMIAPGESPDGGWPFVKLLNFGLASLELHSDSAEASELAPSISPQFASPEQRNKGEIDFRSEMYSLGATMCFLLTGAAPLAVSGMKARSRLQRLPEIRRAPKPLHNLLVYLLREDPNNRPQDPVFLENQMRDCLSKIERRQALGRKLGMSLAAVVPRKQKESTREANPVAQVLGGVAAVVILLLAAGGGAAYFFPDKIPFFHRTDKIGVEIGVPDAAKFATTPAQSAAAAPMAADSARQSSPPAVAEANQSPPAETQSGPRADASQSAPVVASNQPTSPDKRVEPPSPAFGPSEPPSAPSTAENPEDLSSAKSEESETETSKATASTAGRKSTRSEQTERRQASRNARTNRDPYVDRFEERPVHARRHRAEVVGRTPDGRLVVRLSSGRTVVLPRVNESVYPSSPRRRMYIEPSEDYAPPLQPFNPNY